jgi:hypothetical protein
MINHARNLLLNTAHTAFNNRVILEEIIDSNYRAKRLPSHLQSIRRAIFGESPDRTMLNYRARQLLSLVHSCELEQFVLEFDPRITYEFGNDTLLDPNAFDIYVDQYQGSRNDIGFIGGPWSPDKHGQMFFHWDVQFVGGDTTIRLLQPYIETEFTPSFTAGLSNTMALPNSPLYVVHHNTPAKWAIQYIAKPTKDLGELLVEIESLGAPTLFKLFGVGTELQNTEPMKTYYNLWRNHYALPYRLGAAVMALIHQTDALSV